MSKVKTQVIKGTTYIFERTSYRVPSDDKVHQKRLYLGKLDEDGQFIPNKQYHAITDEHKQRIGLKPNTKERITRGRKPASEVFTRSFYGATYLFDELAQQLGVTSDLKIYFPGTWKQILSIAWYLILEERNSLSRFNKWNKTHRHPYNEDISSPRSSDLFATINENSIQEFFSSQVKRRLETEYLAYDSTSLSTYSKAIALARRGKNKKHDLLDQINLSLVFGQTSRLPVCYRIMPGNITDVKTVTKLIQDLATMGMGKVKLVMDRGYYSSENISALYRKHYKFLIAAKTSLKFIKGMIDEFHDNICSVEHYLPQQDVYTITKRIWWEVSGTKSSEGNVKRKMYVHLYYNEDKAGMERRAHHKKILMLQKELEERREQKDHMHLYERYFTVKDTPKRGRSITIHYNVIKSEEQYYGFFALLSNCITDKAEALSIYRTKDCVEKAFGNLKERLGLRRSGVSTESHLQGKIFVQYIALIILSKIQKSMRDKKLYSDYTLYSLLDELDVIEYYEHPGKIGHWGEITKKQQGLYKALTVQAPVCII
jgi:transposase